MLLAHAHILYSLLTRTLTSHLHAHIQTSTNGTAQKLWENDIIYHITYWHGSIVQWNSKASLSWWSLYDFSCPEQPYTYPFIWSTVGKWSFGFWSFKSVSKYISTPGYKFWLGHLQPVCMRLWEVETHFKCQIKVSKFFKPSPQAIKFPPWHWTVNNLIFFSSIWYPLFNI